MDGWTTFAIVLVVLVGIGFIVVGLYLWKGKGLRFIAGNQNDFFGDPGSSNQVGLGKTVGGLMIAVGAICLLVTIVLIASTLLR